MGDNTDRPETTSPANASAGEPPGKKRPGQKDGKWGFGGVEGSHSANTPSHEQKVGIGNRKPTDKDRQNALKSKVSTEIAIKPLYSETYFDNTLEPGHGNREGANDKSYYSTLTAKASVEALAAKVDVKALKGKVTLFDGKAKGQVVHGQFDLGGFLHDFVFGKSPEPTPPNPPEPPAPMAARMGDMTTHGTPLAPGSGSTDVIIGGMPAWRVGPDLHACPGSGTPSHGSGPTSVGAPTVLINGFPAARAGDFVAEAVGGPNVITLGCPSVMIGPTAGPPPAAPAPEPQPEDLPWVLFDSVASADAVSGEVSGKLEAAGDLKAGKGKVEVIAGGEAAVLKGELPLKLRIRIPYTTYYLGLGVTGKGTLLAVGAEAGVGGAINENGKLVDFTGGASASIGPGGLGVKFSLDVAKK